MVTLGAQFSPKVSLALGFWLYDSSRIAAPEAHGPREWEQRLDLNAIIETAKRRSAVRAPGGRTLVQIRLDGTPSYAMSNAVAAFQAELEDLSLRRTELVSGGAGCLLVDFDMGDISDSDRDRLSAFFQDGKNLEYFPNRYGINAIQVRQTRLGY
jgi:hypothetical protein